MNKLAILRSLPKSDISPPGCIYSEINLRCYMIKSKELDDQKLEKNKKDFLIELEKVCKTYRKLISYVDINKLLLWYIKYTRSTVRKVKDDLRYEKEIKKRNKRENKKICPECNDIFIYRCKKNQKFCTNECASKNWLKNNKERIYNQKKEYRLNKKLASLARRSEKRNSTA